ncbi:MAG: diguanylate cyclase, partial [Dehalobacterium sp.]
ALGQPFSKIINIIDEKTHKRTSNPIEKVLKTGISIKLAKHRSLITKEGIERPISDMATPFKDSKGNIKGVVFVFRDVFKERMKKEAIIYLSYHDRLTGLYNRAFFEEEAERLDTERQLPISLIMGDVNGLKMTNDVYGHRKGDQLLIAIAKILKDSCRGEDLIARWGGDEFVILLPQTPGIIADEICKRIRKACNKVSLENHTLSISLGFSTKEKASENLMNVLQKAEDYMYKRKLLESKSMRTSIITSMKKTLHEKSHETEEHIDTLNVLTKKIGCILGLSENELNDLEVLSMLHDIGKVAINDSILMKPHELTDEEWIEIKKHPAIGYRIAQSAPELAQIAEYILSHHERWDGKGYPQGLMGESIPLLARILSVVDAYDTMLKDRPYRRALTHSEAKEELIRNAGKQFDPQIVKLFIENVIESKDQ